MNLIMNTNDFNKDRIYLLDPIKNFVLDNALFYKIIYSTNIVTLNNIILDVKFYNVSLCKLNNKYKMIIEKNDNKKTVDILYNIERDILNKINLEGDSIMDMHINILSKNVKVYSEKDLGDKIKELNLKVKISGIWKTKDNYGITYKFSL